MIYSVNMDIIAEPCHLTIVVGLQALIAAGVPPETTMKNYEAVGAT